MTELRCREHVDERVRPNGKGCRECEREAREAEQWRRVVKATAESSRWA